LPIIDTPNHPASLGAARRTEKKIREIKFGNYRRCKFGPHWRNRHRCVNIKSSNDAANKSTSKKGTLQVIRHVVPIRQDIAYSFCFTGAETEIHKIKDDSKINREYNIDRRSQRHIVNVWHLSEPPSFSLPTTFKGHKF